MSGCRHKAPPPAMPPHWHGRFELHKLEAVDVHSLWEGLAGNDKFFMQLPSAYHTLDAKPGC